VDEVTALLTVGRYGTDECLASTDLGAVFRGYDPVLCRPVTIKVLQTEFAKDGNAEMRHERFKRRARAACGLYHPNIPTTFDFGGDNGLSFIVMEEIEGSPLDRLLNTTGPFPPKRAVAIILQILDALKYSHENRVLHLSLNPTMVFVAKTDQVKIADFGVALVNASEPANLGEISSDPSSAAPEQLTGAPVDHRTDLFAAGGLLFEMVTGTRPFYRRTADEVLTQMEIGVPEDAWALDAKVPHALRGVIDKALAYDPAQRFATVGAFAEAIEKAVPLEKPRPEIITGLSRFRTDRLRHEPSGNDNKWDPKILHRLETDLAAHIGPVAAIAVKQAAERANDLVSLCAELSVHVKNEKKQADVLTSIPCLFPETSHRTEVMRADHDVVEPIKRRSQPLDLPNPDVIQKVEAKLTEHLGPIARILVEQQLENFRGLSDLCRSLADRISDETERAAFLHFCEPDRLSSIEVKYGRKGRQ
jgi:serine/threonine-protein kinase